MSMQHQIKLSDYYVKKNTGATNKNVVTDSNGVITTEDKQDITGKEDKTNKKNEISTDAISSSENIYYPSIRAVRNYAQPKGNYLTSQDISGKEDKSNKSSNITTDTGSTTKYPTIKAVEDYVNSKVDASFKVEVIQDYTVQDLEDDYGHSDGNTFSEYISDENISYDANTIYLLVNRSDDPSFYNEYILIDSDSEGYPIFELLGTTQIDLSNYLTKTEAQTNYQPKGNYLTSQDISGKAPNNHASSEKTYGVGTSDAYGHVRVANNISTTSFSASAPVVLSAYQGNILREHIDDLAYYAMKLSNYSPNIGDSITLTVESRKIRTQEQLVDNVIPLYLDGNQLPNITTNNNGQATYTYTCDTWGLHTFSIPYTNSNIQFIVKGWKQYRNDNSYKVYYNDEYVWFRFDISGANANTSWTELGANVFPDAFIRPSTNVFFFIGMTGYIGNVRPDSPKFRYRSQTGSGNNLTFTGEVMWRRR